MSKIKTSPFRTCFFGTPMGNRSEHSERNSENEQVYLHSEAPAQSSGVRVAKPRTQSVQFPMRKRKTSPLRTCFLVHLHKPISNT